MLVKTASHIREAFFHAIFMKGNEILMTFSWPLWYSETRHVIERTEEDVQTYKWEV